MSASQPPAPGIEALLAIMARLRSPGGCPWDRAQDFRSIAPYTIEEAYEVAEAAEAGDMPALKDELGDLLLQVVFHARMAEEAGHFGFGDVVQAISDKMVRRHPHVFAAATAEDPNAVTRAWEDHKATERAAKAAPDHASSALDGIGPGLPALTRAAKLQRRAARVGFDWRDALEIYAKIDEKLSELKAEISSVSLPERIEDELGDLLFSVVNLARKLDFDPEQALRSATRKFERRFRAVEAGLIARGLEPAKAGLDAMEAEWQKVKKDEKPLG
jgi:MazG family protein